MVVKKGEVVSVRVLVADDNPVVRVGLRSLLELEPDIELCAEASSGAQAVELARQHRPDVVLLDVRMPGGGGLDVLEELVSLARVLMLTYSDEPAVVTEALSRGATGYLVHGSFESAELATAIRDTARGSARLSPAAASVLLGRLNGGAAGPPEPDAPHGPVGIEDRVARKYRLSRREQEVAELMVHGCVNTEIAAELFIEEKTVKNHINRIFAKLGADTRPAAIATLLGLRE